MVGVKMGHVKMGPGATMILAIILFIVYIRLDVALLAKNNSFVKNVNTTE